MLFPTVAFVAFFSVVMPLSWTLMARPVAWKLFILVASYVFYATANWKFCLLLAGITLGNQAFATAIVASRTQRRRALLVRLAVALDLLALGVFKYYGFFVTDVADILDAVGLGMPLPLMTIVLPVGISFYTFQAISYVVDAHRGLVDRGRTLDVALYLSFFTHLVAGPIVRAREFLPQLASPRDARDVPVGAAMLLIAIGLVKKIVVADVLARDVVDQVFAVPKLYSGADVLLACYAYAAQIYCDFSGYTDMAIGLALLMGIRFPQNFDRPYGSASLQEFWRRWHMTLSRFLRDFLYIPLGGSRGGRIATARNLMLTMLLGGLWHGAAWGFVIWGGLHGTYLVGERVLRERIAWRPPRWLAVAITFHLVVFAWVFFRASDLGTAFDLLGRLTTPGVATLWAPVPVLITAGVLLLQVAGTATVDRARGWAASRRPVSLGAAFAVVAILSAATISSQGVPPFIYFRF